MKSYIRKSFLLLACALFLVNPFTACGSSSNGSNSAQNDSNDIKFETFADSISLPPYEDLPYDFYFTYSISWPVSGNDEIVKSIRKWIAEQMNCKNISSIVADSTPNLLIKEFSDNGLDDTSSTDLSVSSDIKGSILSLGYDLEISAPMSRPVIYFQRTKINLSNGKVLNRDLFPSDEIMSKLILESLNESSEYGYECPNYSYKFPSSLPSFDENGLLVQYDMYEAMAGGHGMPYITIIYSKILPYLSDELLAFVPKEYYERYKEAPISNNEEIEKEISKFVYSLVYSQEIYNAEKFDPSQNQYEAYSPKMKETFKQFGINGDGGLYFSIFDDQIHSKSFIKLLNNLSDKERDFDWGFITWGGEEKFAFEAVIDDINIVNPEFAKVVIKFRTYEQAPWITRDIEIIKEDGEWKIDNIDNFRQVMVSDQK